MACVGILNGRRIVAGLLSEYEWKEVVACSKRREILMPDTNLPAQAKTRRWDGGITRYFSHFSGEAPEGYINRESPEHMAMKLAVYQRLLELGIPAELEAGMDDWRADILVGPSAFSECLAVEIQITKQSAQTTYERTAQRHRSGIPTLWMFGSSGSSGSLGEDLLMHNPVFTVQTAPEAARVAEAVFRNKAFYDRPELYKKTPARIVALMVNCQCGSRWLYPFGMVLLMNRICGDKKPVYVSCGLTAKVDKSHNLLRQIQEVEKRFNRYMPLFQAVASKYSLGLGVPSELSRRYLRFKYHNSRAWGRGYSCPECGNDPEPLKRGFPSGSDACKCPGAITAEVDAGTEMKDADKLWRVAAVPGQTEEVMSEAEWKHTFIQPLRDRLKEKPQRYTANGTEQPH